MPHFARAAVVLAVALVALLSACSPQASDAAVTVNGESVPLRFYDVLVAASRHRAEQIGIPVAWDSPQGERRLAQIQLQTIKQLVRNAVIDQLARERHVDVTDADLDAAMARVDGAFGGAAVVDQKLEHSGLTRADYRALYRFFLLDQKLRQADPSGYPAALEAAMKNAHVQVYVAPCASDHDYATCLEKLEK